MDPAHLTPPILIGTDVPFPTAVTTLAEDDDTYSTRFEYKSKDRISIKACSELHDHHAPLRYFNVDPAVTLKLIHGPDGHPIIFTLGSDRVGDISRFQA